MKKEGDLLQDDYAIGCCRCGCKEGLQMVAHRNNNNAIVGWLFVCGDCFSALKGRTLAVTLKE